MKLEEVIEKAKKISELTGLKVNTVIGTVKDEEKGVWVVTIELLEKASIPDSQDVLGIYEVEVDEKGGITRFDRKELRRRGETGKGEE